MKNDKSLQKNFEKFYFKIKRQNTVTQTIATKSQHFVILQNQEDTMNADELWVNDRSPERKRIFKKKCFFFRIEFFFGVRNVCVLYGFMVCRCLYLSDGINFAF